MTKICLGHHVTIQCSHWAPIYVEKCICDDLSLEPSCVLHINASALTVFSDTLTFPGTQPLRTLLFRAVHYF